MSEDLGTEIKIGADASGVEAGVSKAKRSLASLGQAAEQVGKAGGDGLLKIGAGGEASARNVDKATKSMIASIQRQTVAFEAGGTSARQYQESLARMRGIDSNVLKPYLDQLDAARNKADAAAKAQNGLGNSLGGLGTAASLARGAITGMLAGLSLGSMFAFVKNINDGVDGLNDLKDATGASIENLSALEDVALRTGTSIDTVGAALVKFNQVLGDAKPGSTQAAALKAIGLSAEELRRLDPAEALRQTAVALSKFADDGNKARLVQELFGKSVKDVAPFLNDLAEKTKLVGTVTDEQRAEAEKLNKQLFEMQKNMLDLSRTMVGPMVTSINEVIKKFKEGRAAGLGFMSIGWQNYKDNVSGFYSWMFGSGQPNTGGATGEWDAPEAPKPSVGSGADPAAAKAAADAAQKAAEAVRREMGEQAKMMAELSGLSGTFAEDWARLTAVYKAGKLSLEQYTQAQADLLAKQPGIKAAADAEAKARDAALKASQLAADARNREADGIAAWLQAQEAAAAQALSGVQSRISGLQDEERAVALASGLNISLAEAIERVALARLEEKQAGFSKGSEGYLAIEREIAARKELITRVAGRATREESAKAAREAEKEWKSSVEKYEDIFRQGFADMLNSGKDGWKSFTKSLVTTFKTTVADQIYKMFAQPFVVKLVGSLLGFTGLSGVAGAASGGSALGAVGTGASIYNAGTGMAGMAGGFANGLSAWGAGGSVTGVLSNPGLYTGAELAGAFAPIALGLLAVAALFKKFDDSGTPHIGAGAIYSEAGGLQEGADIYNGKNFGMGMAEEYAKGTQAGVSTIAKALTQTFDGIAKAFGQTAGYEIATAFADDSSKDGAWGSLRISKDGADLLNWNDTRESKWAPREFANGEEGYKEYLAEIAKDTRTLLLDMDLPSWADTMLESIGDAASMDQLAATVQQIGVIQTTFVDLGKAMEGFAGLTDKAFEALMKAAGGIESLAANAGVYYENFYSASEKTAVVKSGVSADLAAVGIDMPKTREEYRALVDAQLALGESGAAATAVLLEASGAFASFTPTIEQLVESVGINAAQISTTIRDGLLGRISGEEVGASIGKMVTDGIYNAIAGSFADQITQIFMTGIVNPVIQAAITGSSISALVSQASIDAMVQQATAAMTALSTIFEDPEFLTAIAKINGAVGNLSVSPGGKSGLSGAESGYAAPAWEEAIDLDGLTDAVRGSWNGLISEIVNETKTAADELKKLTDFGKSSYQIDMESIQSRAQDRTKEYWTQEREQAVYGVVNVKWQQQGQYDVSAGYYASMGPEWAAMSEWARKRADELGAEITALLATIGSAPPEITALIAAEQELLRVRNTLKAADITGDLRTEIDRLGMSDLERTLVGISDRADDYVKSLQDLGQATESNIGVVGEWEDAMRLDAIKKAWAGVTDSILGEIDRIRGSLSGDSGLAALQAEFAINTASARAGDTEAGGTLAKLSSDILRLSEGNAGSAFDWARMQAQMLASLQETARITSLMGGGMSPVSAASFVAPSQTYEISTPYIPPVSQQGAGNAELIAEIRLLNRRLETLEANTQATALHTQKTSKALERAMPNGDAIATREMA